MPKILKEQGLSKSTSEAIRLMKQNAVRINNELVNNSDTKLKKGDYIIKVGKKKFLRVRIV